jgi:FkbM family methyltransferase
MPVTPDYGGPERSAGAERLRKAWKLLQLLRTRRYRRALRHGVAAAIEHEDLPYPTDLGSVIDVGAHKGQFALFALERFEDAEVICVEPLEKPRRLLTSVVGDEGRVRVLGAAASDRPQEQVEMHVSRSDDSSSLKSIGARQVAAFPGTEEVSRTFVPAERLDALVDADQLHHPALLKIDVQGHEFEVLEGSSGLLPAIGTVVVEVSFAELYEGQRLAGDVTALLHEADFRLVGVFNVRFARSGACLQADFLFERPVDRH